MAEIIKLGSNGNWGVKPNGVLAYNDEDNVFKAIELQSSRASGATYVGEDGLIKDAEVGVPRIDWTNGVGELLLEPQSRNLIPYSEEFDNAAWTKTNATITANSVLSPDGSVNADTLTEDSATGAHRLNDSIIISSSGIPVTQSVFAKSKGDGRFLRIFRGTPSNNLGVFDLDNGVVYSSGGTNLLNAKIEDYGNGWYRCSITFTSVFTNIATYFGLQNGDLDSYAGDGTSGIYIWGAQLEQLSYPTSYIRTEGSQVTRIADAVTGNSSLGQVINSSEGVLYFEGSALVNGADGRITLSDGSISNRVSIEWDALANTIKGFMGSNGLVQTSDYNQTNTLKIALHYKVNDFKMFINGFYVAQDTDVSAQINLNTLSFDNATGSNDFYGRVRELKVYDTALSDSELQALTS